MEFVEMGKVDADAKIQKGSIHGVDVKGATVRLTNDYLELLNVVASEVGLSRQAFMSKIIENYAVYAVADYLAGYSNPMLGDASPHDLFARSEVEGEVKKNLDKFIRRVEDIMIDYRAEAEGIKQLPKDNPEKVAYLEKHRRIIKERFPDALFADEWSDDEGND